jgi:hypothetical protein
MLSSVVEVIRFLSIGVAVRDQRNKAGLQWGYACIGLAISQRWYERDRSMIEIRVGASVCGWLSILFRRGASMQ